MGNEEQKVAPEATTTAVEPVANKEVLSPEDQEIMRRLQAGSGETEQGAGWNFIPYITINNKMVEEELKDGRKVKARCAPEFIVTEKDGDEYKSTPFAPGDGFDGIILKFMHRVQRKWLQDQAGNNINKVPFYRSIEFKAFNSQVYLRSEKNFLAPMSYQDVKKYAGDENELWGVIYFLVPGEEIVRKAEFKGMSRSILYDYMITKENHPVAATITHFGAVVDLDNANPYNKLTITNTNIRPENLAKVLQIQDELNRMIESNLEPVDRDSNALMGEVITQRERDEIEAAIPEKVEFTVPNF